MNTNLAESGKAPASVQGRREATARGAVKRSEVARQETPGALARVAMASMLARPASGPRVGMPSL